MFKVLMIITFFYAGQDVTLKYEVDSMSDCVSYLKASNIENAKVASCVRVKR